jgi:hypothetical protein
MNNLEKAIGQALDDASSAQRHLIKWVDDLTLRINGAVIEHLASKMFISEGMRIRVASMASELANDFVEDTLPRFIHEKTGATKMDATGYANALSPEFLETVANMHAKACIRALDPKIKAHIEAVDKFFSTQPKMSDAGPSMGIDLAKHAAELNQKFALEDARKAAPAAPRGGYVDDSNDPLSVLKAGEQTALQKYPAKKGKR